MRSCKTEAAQDDASSAIDSKMNASREAAQPANEFSSRRFIVSLSPGGASKCADQSSSANPLGTIDFNRGVATKFSPGNGGWPQNA